ncbi:nitrilase-related carbon-nitrogen hydrolase [Pleionea litopenaei]|uniref:Nitrilase-related carbon-nitrogen hydrolase n=1 Tax=Pleionea litopenaei TaxID=3070815 RepID=A0AA51RTC6_9GAMM|nr:nitrilase-related carbon-nitrogen hydrolase [Pleionea sp. HL-JVS1]WMS87155.1 nitrilase-related carbon-nitrogen hydrolase [Pleionea sp. HL-JVS1]
MSTVVSEVSDSSHSQELNVAALQFAPQWQSPRASLDEIEALVEAHLDPLSRCDLIVLPEMFATGFSLDETAAEEPGGAIFQWMKSLSKRLQAAVIGSVKVRDGDQLFNRLYWVQENPPLKGQGDSIIHYDKVHLFGAERKRISAGNQRVIVQYRGFRLFLQTCYDLRFPVFCRNVDDYDVLINIASWPKPRIAHWHALLRARAIENLSFSIGVNRIGSDGNGWEYQGGTEIYSPLGECLANAQNEQCEWVFATLSLQSLQETRQTFRFIDDRDEFEWSRIQTQFWD